MSREIAKSVVGVFCAHLLVNWSSGFAAVFAIASSSPVGYVSNSKLVLYALVATLFFSYLLYLIIKYMIVDGFSKAAFLLLFVVILCLNLCRIYFPNIYIFVFSAEEEMWIVFLFGFLIFITIWIACAIGSRMTGKDGGKILSFKNVWGFVYFALTLACIALYHMYGIYI